MTIPQGFWGGLLAAVCSLMMPTVAADPLAMVTDLTGKAWIAEGTGKRPLAILAYLEPGALVEVEPGGKLSITFYVPPEEYVFSGAAKFQIEAKGPRQISGPAPGVRRLGGMAAQAATLELAGGRRTQAALRMRSLGGIGGMAPNQTAVRAVPRFAWQAVPGAERYRLIVSGRGNARVADQTVAGTEWNPPASVRLEPGVEHNWTVDAMLPSGSTVSGKARFTLLDTEAAARLAAEEPAAGAPFAQRLQFVLTLESLGLFDEARPLWRDLARERPEEPILKQRAQ